MESEMTRNSQHNLASDKEFRLRNYLSLWEAKLQLFGFHYSDVIMGAMTSQITSVSSVYSTACSGGDKKHIKAQSHWPLWGEFTLDRWIPPTEGQLRGKGVHLMTSSCLREAVTVLWMSEAEWVSQHSCYPLTHLKFKYRKNLFAHEFFRSCPMNLISYTHHGRSLDSYRWPKTL